MKLKVKRMIKKDRQSGDWSLNDLTTFANVVRRANTTTLLNSKEAADLLSAMYSDLHTIKVTFLIHDGAVERNHWVNVTSDHRFVIDLTGDRFNYSDFYAYSSNVAPWIYSLQGDLYLSSNRLPAWEEEISPIMTDMDIVFKTNYCPGLRCLSIPKKIYL